MLKQLILFLSIIYSIQCLSARSNIWWSRRSDKTAQDCDFEFKNQENPSLAAKICGFCFAKCQQELAECLRGKLDEISNDSIDSCQHELHSCEKHCLNDKRTSHIAEVNWAKVVQILQQYNTDSLIHLKNQTK